MATVLSEIDAFNLSTIVVSDAATIIVNATIKVPAVREKIKKTNNAIGLWYVTKNYRNISVGI